MAVNWTKEQQQVIDLRDRNILVSAAAGSGKTAVLVARIIARLTTDVPPVDIDRLLVVTYTEAAAAEMKERIREAIERKLEEEPENIHLQKQSTLVHSALVTTIHSFCLSVIREHFHTIDLDPGFRIAEEGELKLLKHDIVQEVLETHFEEGTSSFYEFVEYFATGKDDKKLEELILKLYEFSRSYEEPEVWLDSCARNYGAETLEEMEYTPAIELAVRRNQTAASDAKELLCRGLQVCDDEEGPYMYRQALESDLKVVEGLASAATISEMYACFMGVKWERLAPNKDKTVSIEKADFVKSVRAEVKKMLSGVGEQYCYQTPEELLLDMKSCHDVTQILTGLVQEYSDTFDQKKRSKNMIDFSDMERFALRILTKKGAHGLEPSDVAKEYQTKFTEVMIDEYQDSNLIQEAILTSVSSVSQGRYNVFMVGDVKQSIYKFRLSRPELFMEKYDTYASDINTGGDGNKQRIDLHKNFRSREEVLAGTNFIFEQIMTKALGGITYDDKAALYVGADYKAQSGNEAEIMLVCTGEAESDEEETETARELEARAVATRIKELVGKHPIYSRQTGSFRPARYKDIVILTRSLKGWTDVFSSVLQREGVPIYTGTQEGYFSTIEIRNILDYLKVLNNRKQDIPLASVLSSPLGGFQSEELSEIKSAYGERSFCEAVLQYEKEGENCIIREKLTICLMQMEHFRKMVPYTAIHDLLYMILDTTGYGEYAQAMPGGAQRKANLDMLVEKAKAFETTSYKGLFNFVRYIEQLKKYEVDCGEANITDEQADIVRMMSIHKSKGLEFPIVIVVGMNKRFNMQDTKGSIVLHPDYGIGIDAIDMTMRTKEPSLLKKIIQKELVYEGIAEELRVLYVALTRAEEKLIMVGTIGDTEALLKGYESVRLQKETQLSFSQLAKVNTYFGWVLPALIRHRSFAKILARYGIEAPFTNVLYNREVAFIIKEVQKEQLIKAESLVEVRDYIDIIELRDWDAKRNYNAEMKARLETQFAYTYPYEKEGQLKLKFTVSELKKRIYMEEESGEVLYEEAEVMPLLPKFLQEDVALQGASRGSAYHKLLELIDFKRIYDKKALVEAIDVLRQSGSLSEKMVASIRIEDIHTFLSSSIATRMKAASEKGLLKVEQPFVLGVPATQIYHEESSSELVLIQGIIDAYFEEDGELVVLDYKTDNVRDKAVLEEKYHMQLTYYAQALEQLTGKRVKEKWIYSFTLQEGIEVSK